LAAAGTPCPDSKKLQTTTNEHVEKLHDRRMKLGKHRMVANVLLGFFSLAIKKGKKET
jgi:hypothetical protein